MKVIAWYLPQFHRVEENDAWWGEGFTEWTNVRRARSLFPGHRQPRAPLGGRYYDLLEDGTLEWQVDLARRHGIDGFCLYHYWFSGRLILERPVERLLARREIDFPFCLSWANEPWTRAWDGGDREILLAQDYGDEGEWKAHFEYLLPFFRDGRYIKVDGKPMLLVYRTSGIPRCGERIAYYDALARESGFPGMHVVETLNRFQRERACGTSSADVYMEPMMSMSHDLPLGYRIRQKIRRELKVGRACQTIDYAYVWERILARKYPEGRRSYYGAFVDWDNTPRRGERGVAIVGGSPDSFAGYFARLVEDARREGVEYLFINAWNEWAEGAYLEPDADNGLAYLQAVAGALGAGV